MDKSHFFYMFGSKRDMSFYDQKNKCSYLREIVYPIECSERELKEYVKKSLSREIYQLIFHRPEECLIFYETRKTKEIETIGSIDKYWITGEVMVVDYFVNDQKKHLEIVIDMNLDKQIVYSQVKNILSCEYKSDHILFYESTNECWIKRI